MSRNLASWWPLLALPFLLGATSASAAVYETKARCGGPLKGWALPKDHIPHLALFVTITQDEAGAVFWNGLKVTQAQFVDFLRRLPKGNPRAFTIFSPKENVDCGMIIAMRSKLEKALECSKGWCGEGTGFTYNPKGG